MKNAYPCQKLLVRSWIGPDNFSKIFDSIKSYSTFSQGQADEQTDRHMPSYLYTDRPNFFLPFLYLSLDYIHFAHSVREG
jgi:hypothetical protein